MILIVVGVLLLSNLIAGCGDSKAQSKQEAQEEAQQKAREFNDHFYSKHPAPDPNSKGAGMPDFK